MNQPKAQTPKDDVSRLFVVLTISATVLIVVLNTWVIRELVRAYTEEREHSAFLYDCTHHQRPAECENVWLSQYAHTAPPWE